MKYITTVAVLALLNSAAAIKLRDDDLFSDDYQAEESLASIEAAEKAHGAKFSGINEEDQKSLIKAKTTMNFGADDEFLS